MQSKATCLSKRVFGRIGIVSMALKVAVKDFSVYRIKHLPSGLYFTPSRKVKVTDGHDYDYVKSNLSKRGKVYPMKPTLRYLGDRYYTHLNPVSVWVRGTVKDRLVPVVATEWAIEKV